MEFTPQDFANGFKEASENLKIFSRWINEYTDFINDSAANLRALPSNPILKKARFDEITKRINDETVEVVNKSGERLDALEKIISDLDNAHAQSPQVIFLTDPISSLEEARDNALEAFNSFVAFEKSVNGVIELGPPFDKELPQLIRSIIRMQKITQGFEGICSEQITRRRKG